MDDRRRLAKRACFAKEPGASQATVTSSLQPDVKLLLFFLNRVVLKLGTSRQSNRSTLHNVVYCDLDVKGDIMKPKAVLLLMLQLLLVADNCGQ